MFPLSINPDQPWQKKCLRIHHLTFESRKKMALLCDYSFCEIHKCCKEKRKNFSPILWWVSLRLYFTLVCWKITTKKYGVAIVRCENYRRIQTTEKRKRWDIHEKSFENLNHQIIITVRPCWQCLELYLYYLAHKAYDTDEASACQGLYRLVNVNRKSRYSCQTAFASSTCFR